MKRADLIEKIFSICYSDKTHPLKECIISVGNLFGFEELKEKVSSTLSAFLWNLPDDSSKINFLKDYWFLINDDAIAFIVSAISQFEHPNKEECQYNVNYDINQFSYDSSRDKLLDLIAYSFNYYTANLEKMLCVALDYVRYRPELAPQLSWHIENTFGITIDDLTYGLPRHLVLLKTLDEGMNGDLGLENEIFWKHIGLFLKTYHNYSRSTYHKNEIRLLNIDVDDCDSVINLHNIVWDMAERHFESNYFREAVCNLSSMLPCK